MNACQRQEFCVRWNSHLGSIGAAFPQLLAGQRFVDVTLACEGHQVLCHRLVLAACSDYFESILAENPCKHPVIILPSEVKLWEIQALVDFMYKGEVNVTQAGLPQLLRCAEQLRIRGLYGSDAALNLNQLKALTNKGTVATTPTNMATSNDGNETDDTNTNSTTTTTTAVSALQQLHATAFTMKQESGHTRRRSPLQQANDTNALKLSQQLQLQKQQQQQQQQLLQQKQHQQQLHIKQEPQLLISTSNAPTEDDDSAEDSNGEQYEEYAAKVAQHRHPQLESTIEDDHNYVATHDEEDSYSASAVGADTEQESLANSSSALQQSTSDLNASFKRVRRSEASLEQAAKCVSKGQTFQTVSNMFNIPVSTIRFYMARKGILPKRKRGRGASNSSSSAAVVSAASLSSEMMSHALAQMKRSSSPTLDQSYHLVGYKMN